LINTSTKRGMRFAVRGSLVTCYKLDKDGNRVDIHYQLPDGQECDENGYLLGEVKFKARVIR